MKKTILKSNTPNNKLTPVDNVEQFIRPNSNLNHPNNSNANTSFNPNNPNNPNNANNTNKGKIMQPSINFDSIIKESAFQNDSDEERGTPREFPKENNNS